MDSESRAPTNVNRTCADPLSLASLDAAATLGPANHVTRESSTLRLSAAKSNASVPRSGRRQPSAPLAVVSNPGCCSRSESTNSWPSAEPVERQRVSADVSRHAEDVRPRVESNDATDDAHGTVPVVMPERAAERRVFERAGQRAARVQLALEVERRDEPPDGADVDAAGRHGERLKGEIFPCQIDLPLAHDLAFGPAGHQRVAEGPGSLDLQRAHRPVNERLTGQAAVERQRIDVDARKVEREIVRCEIALPERHQP